MSIGLIALGVAIWHLPVLLRSGPDRPEFSFLDPFAPLSDWGTVPADSLPTDSPRVMGALREVQDPEVPISIVDLGLVHELTVLPAGDVELTMILTTPECPFPRVIAQRAMNAIKAVPGVRRVDVRLDPSIAWTPDRLSPGGRRLFPGLFPDDSKPGR